MYCILMVTKEAVINLLKENRDRAISLREIISKLKAPYNEVKPILEELERSGYVRTMSHGGYKFYVLIEEAISSKQP
ncbi:MAG: hypothetical protein ACP5JF_00785 [Candidatus Methanodesulfokora sp.]